MIFLNFSLVITSMQSLEILLQFYQNIFLKQLSALITSLPFSLFQNTGHLGNTAFKNICKGLKKGIKDMYPSNNWYFIHCSEDGPWCKPCAEQFLVYNPKCGQCEQTKDGPCTGPSKYTILHKIFINKRLFDPYHYTSYNHLWLETIRKEASVYSLLICL